MGTTDDIKDALRQKSPKQTEVIPDKDLLSSGSTILNLACSGRTIGAFAKGKYYYFVGDSSSGKTFFTLTCFAEAANNPNFDDYRLIYDDVEGGALMDFEKFFGKKAAKRIEIFNSGLIEEFYGSLDGVLAARRPCIYVLDSMDGLSSYYEHKKFDELMEKGEKAKGDYGDGKAQVNSRYLRKMLSAVRDTGSILILISQTRDNIDAKNPFAPKKTRAGGHAPTFYATLEVWTSKGTLLKRRVRGEDRQIGIVSNVSVKKNRVTGRERFIQVPFYHSFGFDDTGGMVDWLVKEKQWKRNADGVITASDYDLEEKRERLIEILEKKNLIDDVRDICQSTWDEIEAKCAVSRKRRYD